MESDEWTAVRQGEKWESGKVEKVGRWEGGKVGRWEGGKVGVKGARTKCLQTPLALQIFRSDPNGT